MNFRVVAVGLLAACVVLPSFSVAAEKPAKELSGMIYELRTYTTHEGRLPALHKRFREHTMTLFAKHGMTNVIYWTPTDQPNTLIYLLAHKSVEDAQASFKAFRDDPEWKKAFEESHKDGVIVKEVISQFLQPTDYSPVVSLDPAKNVAAGSVYELRIYTTNDGKLPNLNARFRDHTMRLFKKHGIENFLYATPVDEEQGKNTLVYFIAHKSLEDAKRSWDAFRQDPEWQKVAAESQKDGRILVPGGVKSIYLTPTDFSPIR